MKNRFPKAALIADGQPRLLHCETDPKGPAEWRAILAKSGRSLDTEIVKGRAIAEAIQGQLSLRGDLLSFCLRAGPDEAEQAG